MTAESVPARPAAEPDGLLLPQRAPARWMAAHPRACDVLVIVAYAAPVLTMLWFALFDSAVHYWWFGGHDRELPLLLAAACTVGVSIALWWRRRHPLAVLVIAVVLGGLNPLYGGVGVAVSESVFTVYAVASWRRPPVAVLGLSLSMLIPGLVVTAAAAIGLRSGDIGLGLQPLVLVAFAIGLAVRSARERRRSQEQLVASRVERAALAERTRITAEMHDVVAHSLTVMMALAGGARAGWQKHPERARDALDQLNDVGAQALAEMQRILRVLQSDGTDAGDLRDSGLDLPPLGELAATFRTAGLPVRLEEDGGPPADPALRTTVHRIVQEALTNALRYARSASEVRVAVRTGPDEVTVTVEDDGHGSPPADVAGAGVGLRAMRERAAAFGGDLDAGPTGRGWRVRATLPRTERT